MNESKTNIVSQSPSISFFCRSSKKSTVNKLRIYIRITYNRCVQEFSTRISIEPKYWDQRKQLARGNSETSRSINESLSDYKSKIFKVHLRLSQQEETFDVKDIVNSFKGNQKRGKGIIELIDLHNKYKEGLVNTDISQATIERYYTLKKHFKRFLKEDQGTDDILLDNLKYAHAIEFESFLKTELGIGHNTSVKYVKNLKTVVRYGMDLELLDKDPFLKYKSKIKEVKRGFLTEKELSQLMNKQINNQRISMVRDAFIFCCYTGLAYSDIESLTLDNITMGMDGEQWIKTTRKKTGNEVHVPLFERALNIIKKYNDHPLRINENKVIPVISNQKMNVYLKEIADICGIHHNLTTHLARHTFATTITLEKGISLESVSKMLGHSNLKTTQIYAKITDTKVAREINKIKHLYSNPKSHNQRKIS